MMSNKDFAEALADLAEEVSGISKDKKWYCHDCDAGPFRSVLRQYHSELFGNIKSASCPLCGSISIMGWKKKKDDG